MKSITEFPLHTLQKVLTAKAALVAEGKTADEISASIGESFKYEGDKLKYAVGACDLIADKKDIRRVLVVSFAEGETVPPQYTKVEESYYLVETLSLKPIEHVKPDARGGRGGGRGGQQKSGPKSSPWGMSPEEKAAKNKPAAAKATT